MGNCPQRGRRNRLLEAYEQAPAIEPDLSGDDSFQSFEAVRERGII